MYFAIDPHEHLIQMPDVVWSSMAMLELLKKRGPKLKTSLAHAFIDDEYPASRYEFFDLVDAE